MTGAEQDQLPCKSTGTSSENLFKRRKLVWFGHVTRHKSLSKNHPSWHLGGWATPWSAEETLDGQHGGVDIPVHATTAYKGLLQKRLEEDLCFMVPHVPSTTQSVKGLEN